MATIHQKRAKTRARTAAAKKKHPPSKCATEWANAEPLNPAARALLGDVKFTDTIPAIEAGQEVGASDFGASVIVGASIVEFTGVLAQIRRANRIATLAGVAATLANAANVGMIDDAQAVDFVKRAAKLIDAATSHLDNTDNAAGPTPATPAS